MPGQLTLVSPQEGEEIFSENITVSAITTGCIQGVDCHLLLWLDEESPHKENALIHRENTSFVFQEVLPGKHKLIVELVKKDSHPFEPKVFKVVNFNNQTSYKTVLSQIPTPLKITSTQNPKLAISQVPFLYPTLFLGLFLIILGLWRFMLK